jgi:predicted acylesterase/phospholipase RssA
VLIEREDGQINQTPRNLLSRPPNTIGRQNHACPIVPNQPHAVAPPPRQRKLQQLLGSYTFLEAYERTGRILNVSVCPADTNEPPRLLNYLTAPQVRSTRPPTSPLADPPA